MLLHGRGIVFHNVRYGESSLISRIYTREAGLLSFHIKGVRNQKGAIRPSHLIPLNLLEMVFQWKQNGQLQLLRELKCAPVLSEVHHDPVKRSIAMFLSELVNRVIREEEKNEELFDFLWNSVQILDLSKHSLANYPVYFSLQLSRYLGFFPSSDYRSGQCFDLLEGTYSDGSRTGLHYLNAEESALVNALCRIPVARMHEVEMNGVLRRRIMDSMIRYYQLHLDQFRNMQSPEILREVLTG